MREKVFNGKPVKVVANVVLEPDVLRVDKTFVYGYRIWHTDHYITDHLLLESMFTRGGFVEGNYYFSDDGIYLIDENSTLLGEGILNGVVEIKNSKVVNFRLQQHKGDISRIDSSTVDGCYGSNLFISNSIIEGSACSHSSIIDSYLNSSYLTNIGSFKSYLYNSKLENMSITSGEIINCTIKSPACISAACISAMNNFDYTEIIGIGSEGSNRILFAFHNFNEEIMIKCGCWYGSIDEFIKRVENVYTECDDPYSEYMRAIEFIEVKMSHPGKNICLSDRGKKLKEFLCEENKEKNNSMVE